MLLQAPTSLGLPVFPVERERSTVRLSSAPPACSRTFLTWVMHTGIDRTTCLVCPSAGVMVPL
ncbi:hypothetical protein D3C85_1720160 [compost metagenome]